MIAALTITSLDQGKGLAHRQVAKFYAEPTAQVVNDVAVVEAIATRAQDHAARGARWIRNLFRSGMLHGPSAYSGLDAVGGCAKSPETSAA